MFKKNPFIEKYDINFNIEKYIKENLSEKEKNLFSNFIQFNRIINNEFSPYIAEQLNSIQLKDMDKFGKTRLIQKGERVVLNNGQSTLDTDVSLKYDTLSELQSKIDPLTILKIDRVFNKINERGVTSELRNTLQKQAQSIFFSGAKRVSHAFTVDKDISNLEERILKYNEGSKRYEEIEKEIDDLYVIRGKMKTMVNLTKRANPNKDWIQGAFKEIKEDGTSGAFTRYCKAKFGATTVSERIKCAKTIKRDYEQGKGNFDLKTYRRAVFYLNIVKASRDNPQQLSLFQKKNPEIVPIDIKDLSLRIHKEILFNLSDKEKALYYQFLSPFTEIQRHILMYTYGLLPKQEEEDKKEVPQHVREREERVNRYFQEEKPFYLLFGTNIDWLETEYTDSDYTNPIDFLNNSKVKFKILNIDTTSSTKFPYGKARVESLSHMDIGRKSNMGIELISDYIRLAEKFIEKQSTSQILPPFEKQVDNISNYEEFKKLYTQTLTELLKYSPDQVGSQTFARRLGILEDTYPTFVNRFEKEEDKRKIWIPIIEKYHKGDVEATRAIQKKGLELVPNLRLGDTIHAVVYWVEGGLDEYIEMATKENRISIQKEVKVYTSEEIKNILNSDEKDEKGRYKRTNFMDLYISPYRPIPSTDYGKFVKEFDLYELNDTQKRELGLERNKFYYLADVTKILMGQINDSDTFKKWKAYQILLERNDIKKIAPNRYYNYISTPALFIYGGIGKDAFEGIKKRIAKIERFANKEYSRGLNELLTAMDQSLSNDPISLLKDVYYDRKSLGMDILTRLEPIKKKKQAQKIEDTEDFETLLIPSLQHLIKEVEPNVFETITNFSGEASRDIDIQLIYDYEKDRFRIKLIDDERLSKEDFKLFRSYLGMVWSRKDQEFSSGNKKKNRFLNDFHRSVLDLVISEDIRQMPSWEKQKTKGDNEKEYYKKMEFEYQKKKELNSFINILKSLTMTGFSDEKEKFYTNLRNNFNATDDLIKYFKDSNIGYLDIQRNKDQKGRLEISISRDFGSKSPLQIHNLVKLIGSPKQTENGDWVIDYGLDLQGQTKAELKGRVPMNKDGAMILLSSFFDEFEILASKRAKQEKRLSNIKIDINKIKKFQLGKALYLYNNTDYIEEYKDKSILDIKGHFIAQLNNPRRVYGSLYKIPVLYKGKKGHVEVFTKKYKGTDLEKVIKFAKTSPRPKRKPSSKQLNDVSAQLILNIEPTEEFTTTRFNLYIPTLSYGGLFREADTKKDKKSGLKIHYFDPTDGAATSFVAGVGRAYNYQQGMITEKIRDYVLGFPRDKKFLYSHQLLDGIKYEKGGGFGISQGNTYLKVQNYVSNILNSDNETIKELEEQIKQNFGYLPSSISDKFSMNYSMRNTPYTMYPFAIAETDKLEVTIDYEQLLLKTNLSINYLYGRK